MNPDTLRLLELLEFHADDDPDPRTGQQFFQHAMHDIGIEINATVEPYHLPQIIHHAGQAYAKKKIRDARNALQIAIDSEP